MEIFESDDEDFEQIRVGERNDDPFQMIVLICPAFYACLVILGNPVTIRTDFRMRL